MKLHVNEPACVAQGEPSVSEAIDELSLVLRHYSSAEILAMRDRLADNLPKFVRLSVMDDGEPSDCDVRSGAWRDCQAKSYSEPLFWEPNAQASFGFLAI